MRRRYHVPADLRRFITAPAECCPGCDRPIQGNGVAGYCSEACRVGHKARLAAAAIPPSEHTVSYLGDTINDCGWRIDEFLCSCGLVIQGVAGLQGHSEAVGG